VIGTIINVAAVLVGGGIGLTSKLTVSPANESFLKVLLAVATVWFGLRLAWLNVSGGFLQIMGQLLVVIVAMMLGKLLGRLLRLQKISNSLGQFARERISEPGSASPNRINAGFQTCSALFCAAPLGFLGAVTDGFSGYVEPLIVKAVMEGLATLGFVRLFGWGCLLAVIPMLAVQGSLTLLCFHALKPWLEPLNLTASINATAGLLIFAVALVILGLKKVELADYLPSLAVAPLLTWIFR
jgi:hypothetical protein